MAAGRGGSPPMAGLTVAVLHQSDLRAAALSQVVPPVLAAAILLAALLLFQNQVMRLANAYGDRIAPGRQTVLTIGAGDVLGGLVAARVSASAIRGTLAAILCVVAAKLLF